MRAAETFDNLLIKIILAICIAGLFFLGKVLIG